MERQTTFDAASARAHHARMTLGNWSDDPTLMHYSFLHLSEFFPHAVIHRSGAVSRLECEPRNDLARFEVNSSLGTMSLEDYVDKAPVNGVAVAQGGRVVFERYPRMRATDKHLLMSVSKIFVATVVAMLEDQELLDVRRAIDSYLPELEGSGWQGVPIIDVLDMASGIDCPEEGVDDAYSNPQQPYYHYEASLDWLAATDATPDTPYTYMTMLRQARACGYAFEYTSVNTFVLSWLAEHVLARPFSEIVTDYLWSAIGAESDALISTSRNANAQASHGGISTTLRDLLRIGLLFTPGQRSGGSKAIISERYIENITHHGRPELFMRGTVGPDLTEELGEQPRHNTYQWDFVMQDGDFFKAGYGGQGLYISPARELVIAYFGTPGPEGEVNQMCSVSRQLALGAF